MLNNTTSNKKNSKQLIKYFGYYYIIFRGRTGLYLLLQVRVNKPFIRSFQSNDRRCLQFPIIHHDNVFWKPLNTKRNSLV